MAEDDERELLDEALSHLVHLFVQAGKTGVQEPGVGTLATVDEFGQPTLRTMTFNHFDKEGIVFFTHCSSRKGRHLARNPRAALCFYWNALNEQVTVEGSVEPVPESAVVESWESRSRDDQFAAWASEQSARLDSRDTLHKRLAKCREQFINGRVPKPPHWRGYRVRPQRIEFWRAGWRPLYERVCYERRAAGWEKYLLNP